MSRLALTAVVVFVFSSIGHAEFNLQLKDASYIEYYITWQGYYDASTSEYSADQKRSEIQSHPALSALMEPNQHLVDAKAAWDQAENSCSDAELTLDAGWNLLTGGEGKMVAADSNYEDHITDRHLELATPVEGSMIWYYDCPAGSVADCQAWSNLKWCEAEGDFLSANLLFTGAQAQFTAIENLYDAILVEMWDWWYTYGVVV